jgi:hypothetical protein
VRTLGFILKEEGKFLTPHVALPALTAVIFNLRARLKITWAFVGEYLQLPLIF